MKSNNNLEANLHIEIDMERIEDRSKALSYIGIEVADALKTIPTPIEISEPVQEEVQEIQEVAVQEPEQVQATVQNEQTVEQQQYAQETTFEAKPTLWQRIKNSKVVRAIKYVMKIRVVLQYPALPEGRGENY